MSAAGPLPPPYPSGQPKGSASHAAQLSPNGGMDRALPHINDLKKQAAAYLNAEQSIVQWLTFAERAATQATFQIEHHRPDAAFVEYLCAFEIMIVVIPHHHDYITFMHDQRGKERLNVLLRRLNSMNEQFQNVKQIIIENNMRSGVVAREQNTVAPKARAQPERVSNDATYPRSKPATGPKPVGMQSRPITPVGPTIPVKSDQLTSRFAQLRMSSYGNESKSLNSSVHSLSLSASESDFGTGPSPFSSNTSFVSTKPQGPRSMPGTLHGSGSPLNAPPLNTQIAAALPKAPPPTYSPARNMQITGNINPPRYTPRSLASSNTRKSSLPPYSSASSTAPSGSDNYFPNHSPEADMPSESSNRTSDYTEPSVPSSKLFDYMKCYDILLIDFRPRVDFDAGHIHAANILCIEPLTVRQGISAEEIQDTLVLSPEDEQSLWLQRQRFQLVVYYDQQTQSADDLQRPSNEDQKRLGYLHEALFHYSEDKKLQRPPVLLAGGLDSWIDLLGPAALETTNTQADLKAGRPIQRRPGQLQNNRRRYRDFNPLNAEETQKWRARAMSEQFPKAPSSVAEDDVIDEFNQRFPDVSSFETRAQGQFTAGPQPSPAIPPKIPQYPSIPFSSSGPQSPKRPPPAAPRPSYTGVSDPTSSIPAPRMIRNLTPYIPPKWLTRNRPIPTTGLYNFSNTCYMNATLQALSATLPLTNIFLGDTFRSAVRKNYRGCDGLLPEVYSALVRRIWLGKETVVKPDTLQSLSGRYNHRFKDVNAQQDAQEFFSFLVDGLHEDLNVNFSRNPLPQLTDQQEIQRERMPPVVVAKYEWTRYAHRDSSYLTSIFYGHQSSRLQCRECGATSTTFEPWAVLSVAIPMARSQRGQDTEEREYSTLTLYQCLQNHFKLEELHGENGWHCRQCKRCQPSNKKLTITRAPPVLVIQLGRFRTQLSGADAEKIHTDVKFPLEGLNIEEFMLPQQSDEDVSSILRNFGPDALSTDSSLTPPYIYELYAIVIHQGKTPRSGHYTTLVKDNARKCWRWFNDSRSEAVKPGDGRWTEILGRDGPYLLLYQRTTADESNGIPR